MHFIIYTQQIHKLIFNTGHKLTQSFIVLTLLGVMNFVLSLYWVLLTQNIPRESATYLSLSRNPLNAKSLVLPFLVLNTL